MQTTKRLAPIGYYTEIAQKLERYAQKGLILEKVGAFFWTYRKAAPQKRKYTVAYFPEGSVFNPRPTDNQQTYFDYAAAAGWDFVCEWNQLQIFSSALENPPPFETDEAETLENMHKCMKKGFVPTQLLMLVMFGLNLYLRLDSLRRNPTDFLSSTIDLATLLLFFIVTVYTLHSLLQYWLWYKRSQKSIAMGGCILERAHKVRKYMDIGYLTLLFCLVAYLFFRLLSDNSLGILALSMVQLPLFALVFWGSITLLKRRNFSATVNRIVSVFLLILTGVLYLSVVFYAVARFDFPMRSDRRYTTVDWAMYEGMTREYRLYDDPLPLTCEDLYGAIDFAHYSSEATLDETPLLRAAQYSQTAPPMKNAPPELTYSIYQPKLPFVKRAVTADLTQSPDWSDRKIEALDNALFATENAFAFYYDDADGRHYTGEYVLVFAHEIVHIQADAPLTAAQIDIVKSRLPVRQWSRDGTDATW